MRRVLGVCFSFLGVVSMFMKWVTGPEVDLNGMMGKGSLVLLILYVITGISFVANAFLSKKLLNVRLVLVFVIVVIVTIYVFILSIFPKNEGYVLQNGIFLTMFSTLGIMVTSLIRK